MKNFWMNFLATVAAGLITAAITANALLLFRFNERLARIETKLEIQSPAKPLAQNEH